MADLTLLKQEFANYTDSLKETSRGGQSNNEFLCESSESVYNFEKYANFKEQKEKNHNFNGKRFDALYMRDDIIYCVEFKIEKCSSIDKQEIDGKFIDSFKILKHIFSELNLQIKDYAFNFFVVFQDVENFFAKRKIKDKCSFKLEQRLTFLKSTNFPQLQINIKADCKNTFLQIYYEIFNTKC